VTQDPESEPASRAAVARALLLLITAWSLLAGLALLAAGEGALALADDAGQRLVGAHMLVLTPLYFLIAWKPDRYWSLIWVPLFAQAAMFFSVAYSMLVGDTGFTDGILAVVVSGVLAGLLGFVWISEQRATVVQQYEARHQSQQASEAEAEQQQTGEDDSGDEPGQA